MTGRFVDPASLKGTESTLDVGVVTSPPMVTIEIVETGRGSAGVIFESRGAVEHIVQLLRDAADEAFPVPDPPSA